MITQLHRLIGREEFDYPALKHALAGYANPNQKIGALIRKVGHSARFIEGLGRRT